MRRRDYAFPFRIDSGTRQAAQAGYADHVRQMVKQLLLTNPGERVDLPELGCGLRQLLFAPHSDALDATTEMVVMAALRRWLAGRIDVQRVHIATPDEAPDRAQLQVEVTYLVLATRTVEQTVVKVGL
jgi:phage baseplate assembly protein W